MQNVFVVPMKRVDADWNLAILDYDFCAFEYCEEVLDIPLESIYDAHLTSHGIEISLMDLDDVVNEDWCIQLERISTYALAS
ncbi:hypothetical protein KKC13_08450 [bacterium]|nr:hypothetical protein [bacterium]MBU1958885.1 hypothetical protein [bacterium]